jgi:hypothetical protein
MLERFSEFRVPKRLAPTGFFFKKKALIRMPIRLHK